jgi:hypothetical protein
MGAAQRKPSPPRVGERAAAGSSKVQDGTATATAVSSSSSARRDSNGTFVTISIYGVLLKYHLKVGVEESIVNAPRITTDHGFKSNLTFCVVCVFTLKTDEWCVHNQLFNAYFEAKFKKNTPYNIPTYSTIEVFAS